MPNTITLRGKLEAGKGLIGTWSCIGSIIAVESLALLPLDFVVLDLQHGELDLHTLLQVLPVFRSAHPVPIVRMLDHSPSNIGRVLDFGVEAIMVPCINDAATVSRCVAAASYNPVGTRSFGPLRPSLCNELEALTPEEKGRHVCMIAQIETSKALENLDKILQTNGLGCAFVGPNDLRLSLGMRSVEDIDPIMKHIIERCNHFHVPCGTMAVTLRDAKRWLGMGAQLVSAGVDSFLIKDSARDLISALRDQMQTA
jgi:2-keto-3-deoxy-L-rhamnonate aldolase RhmA